MERSLISVYQYLVGKSWSEVTLTKAKMNQSVNMAILRPYRSLTKCMVVMAMICPTDWMALQEETIPFQNATAYLLAEKIPSKGSNRTTTKYLTHSMRHQGSERRLHPSSCQIVHEPLVGQNIPVDIDLNGSNAVRT